MNTQIDLNVLQTAVRYLKKVWPQARPQCGIVLGSGWAAAVEHFSGEEISYNSIPGLGDTGVIGHAGRLRHSCVNGMEFFIFQGRHHWYEGKGWTPVALPIYLLQAFGASTVLLTNASGGIRNDLAPGTLMAISDHINMLGSNPLIGPHRPQLGSRFPDQSALYNPSLRKALLAAGADAEGVYVATTGPTFETPAEIRQYRAMGADAVGMSTVPEAIVANALGLRVAGLACICNWAAGLGHKKLTHEDVGAVATATMPRMQSALQHFFEQQAFEPHPQT